jgi:methyltransferase (TIGR00027 family)
VKLICESFAGLGTAATRVVELYQPKEKRLFDDHLALDLLPFGWRAILRLLFLPGLRGVILTLRERRMPGTLGAILCRTRYIDDVLKRALEDGLEQLVILGAGFDSRAYRIADVNQVQVFEIDLPGTRELKQTRVEKVLGAVPQNVTLIGMNFDQQSLDDVLRLAGFQNKKRTLFIWEGVTQYITAEAVHNTLEFVSRVSGVGGAIVFTYLRQELVDGTDGPEWFGDFTSLASKLGSPLTFGLDPAELEQYLSNRGLTLVCDVGADDYRELYLKSLRRDMNVFEGERVALAEVAGVPGED